MGERKRREKRRAEARKLLDAKVSRPAATAPSGLADVLARESTSPSLERLVREICLELIDTSAQHRHRLDAELEVSSALGRLLMLEPVPPDPVGRAFTELARARFLVTSIAKEPGAAPMGLLRLFSEQGPHVVRALAEAMLPGRIAQGPADGGWPASKVLAVSQAWVFSREFAQERIVGAVLSYGDREWALISSFGYVDGERQGLRDIRYCSVEEAVASAERLRHRSEQDFLARFGDIEAGQLVHEWRFALEARPLPGTQAERERVAALAHVMRWWGTQLAGDLGESALELYSDNVLLDATMRESGLYPEVSRLIVGLADVEPLVWRILEVEGGTDLDALAKIIQRSLGRDEEPPLFLRPGADEMVAFRPGRYSYERVPALLDQPSDHAWLVGRHLPDWAIAMKLVSSWIQRDPGVSYPRCVAGAGDPPPMGIEGPEQYREYLRVKDFPGGEGWDPAWDAIDVETFSVKRVNRDLWFLGNPQERG